VDQASRDIGGDRVVVVECGAQRGVVGRRHDQLRVVERSGQLGLDLFRRCERVLILRRGRVLDAAREVLEAVLQLRRELDARHVVVADSEQLAVDAALDERARGEHGHESQPGRAYDREQFRA
jgi:hypothetical protein